MTCALWGRIPPCNGLSGVEVPFYLIAQPFQHGHLCARSLAVETWLPF
jgi:hypothetical protein